ncbi:molybdopterin-dependent oxidoreductase [Paractinoplanes durhamensis]|uniref:Oxidoreductase n=1 Tax=Paractinoplanes durhamensis TaxID=113563 RepID=A0ABQ3Z319_9ACTN|nr:molybdopterin-dependent oxidoreductase [Actinoplanes durhamensis]GIE04217.1 oxidoreductase [Actinoplanes durhamensis]
MRGSLAGLVAAGFGVAVAELLAAATRPEASPLVAVGAAVIDATPTPIKEFAVRELGTHDKPVLLASVGLVLILLAAGTGALGRRHRWAVAAGASVLGAAGASAALSRPAAIPFDAVPSLLGATIAGVTLWWLLHRAAPATAAPSTVSADAQSVATPGMGSADVQSAATLGMASADVQSAATPGEVDSDARSGAAAAVSEEARPVGDFDRRRFLQAAALVAGGAVVAEGGAVGIRRIRGGSAARSRADIRLPAAADVGRPVPPGTGPGFVTGNGDFYRVDTALTVPRIDPDSWSLRIHGMVGNEMRLSFEDLLRRPLVERVITLNCVSNEVGGPYIGTAKWLGVPLAPLLAEAGIKAGADQIVARSAEGMTIGTPTATALDGRDTMLVVGMNGEPLPLEHGFPVRMLTPGLYGYAGACKWLTELELTTFAKFDAYWVERGWSAEGPVKTASRIDKPRPFAHPAAGPVTVAGVAWAQRRGIRAVEVSVDGGDWNRAELLPVPSIDTWVQWRYTWKATTGPHSLAVRATDATGTPQTATRATPFPNGATGLHTIAVTVA